MGNNIETYSHDSNSPDAQDVLFTASATHDLALRFMAQCYPASNRTPIQKQQFRSQYGHRRELRRFLSRDMRMAQRHVSAPRWFSSPQSLVTRIAGMRRDRPPCPPCFGVRIMRRLSDNSRDPAIPRDSNGFQGACLDIESQNSCISTEQAKTLYRHLDHRF